MTAEQFARYVGNMKKDLDDVKVQIGDVGSAAYIDFSQNSIKFKNPYTIVQTRDTGNSFLLGHATWGKLGTQTPQPQLGSLTATAYESVRITSPDKKFEESFGTDRFKSGTTTADWNTGSDSCYFTSSEVAESDFVAFTTGTSYTSGMILPIGSTTHRLTWQASANGGKNYTNMTTGTWTSFGTAGSAVTWKATAPAAAGTISRVDTVEMSYGGDSL